MTPATGGPRADTLPVTESGVGPLSQGELTQLVEAASDVTFTGSLDGRVTWVSPSVARLVGWSPEDLVGRAFVDLVHRDDREAVLAARDRADQREEAGFRVRIGSRDGGYHSVDVQLCTSFDEAGHATHRFGSWRDAEGDVQQRAALEAGLLRSRAIVDGMLDPWILFDPVYDSSGAVIDFLFADANLRACEYNQVPYEQMVGSRLLELLPAHRGSDLFAWYVHTLETGEPLVLDDFTYPREIFGGEERRYDIRASRVAGGLSYTWRDVTDRYEAAQRLAAAEEQYRMLADNSADVVMRARADAIVWMSNSVTAVLGGTPDAWIGVKMADFVHPEDMPTYVQALAAIESGETVVRRARVRAHGDGYRWVEAHAKAFHDANGQRDGFVASMRVVDAEVAAEQELEWLARFDVLTGVLNRAEGLARVAAVTAQPRHPGRDHGVLFCDVDRFKDINDTHGHAAGDLVLSTLTQRIARCVRQEDIVARMGGDEFLVLLTGIHEIGEAATIAEKIRSAATEPIVLGDDRGTVQVSLSIGVALAVPGESSEHLIERADTAMYAAKRSGRNKVTLIQ